MTTKLCVEKALCFKLTFALLKRMRGKSLAECLRTEFRLTQHALGEGDFVEGIRALIVDKDLQPRWRYKKIENVPDASLKSFLRPLVKI